MGRLRVHGTFVAGGDCEADSGDIIAQPVNTASSLGYLLAGAALAGRHAHQPRDFILAGMVAGVGVGSVAFHGPGGPFSLWLHDAAMIGLLTTVTSGNLHELAGGRLAAAAAAGAGTVAAAWITRWPAAGLGLQLCGGIGCGVTEFALIGRDLVRGRPPRSLGPAALLAVAEIVQELSRTGRPLCHPRSRLQGHAVWHLLSAAALYWWGSRNAIQTARQLTSADADANHGAR